MNKRQKEVIQHQLTMEKVVLDELEKEYKEALKDINLKIQMYQAMPETQSRIYHRQYQETLKKQIEAALEKLHSDEYTTINQYLHDTYTDAFVGTMYDIHGQGTPVIAPVDQNAAIKAVMTDTRLNKPLYTKLGVDVNKLKRTVSSEISRGIAAGMAYAEIARNIQFHTNAPIGRAKTIVRTEGHRIQQASAEDARQASKAKGADVVKQWDSTMDGKTRETHRRLDGQIRETDEAFELGTKKAMYPGDFGDPAEDCNCRCVALTRARAALDEEELAILKERAKFFQLDKPKNFGDFKKKYAKAAKQEAKNEATVVEISQKATETLLAAYDDRRKHFGLKYTPADEAKKAGLNPVTVDYTGLSVETAKVFADTFEELARDYYTGFVSIEVAERKEMLGVITYATTKHNEVIVQKTLSINPLKTADYNALVKRIGELSKKGYCAEIKDDKLGSYVMTHEFAHSLLDMKTPLKNYVGMDEKLMRKARKEVDDIYSRYKDEVTELQKVKRSLESKFMLADDVVESEKLRKEFETVRDRLKAVKISDYAMKDADEFLAEAFTQDKIGSIHSPYADELMGVVDKYFKKSGVKAAETVEKQGVLGYNIGAISGAYNDTNDPDWVKRNAHADQYYTSLRNSKKTNVVEVIAKNAGVDKKLVSRMYDHLLVNEYDLDGEKKRFDTSYDIAQSLQRLREGKNIQEHDRILIHHEATEYVLMNRDGMSYDEAHQKANEKYDYASALKKFLKKKDGE